MDHLATHTKREKRHYFFYLLMLFFVSSSLLLWAIFRKSGTTLLATATNHQTYQQKDKDFLKIQEEALPFYDTIFSRIRTLQASPSNTIAVTDLKSQINTLNGYYEHLPAKDPRFVNFHQMALFSKLYLEDMLVYRKKAENIQRFQQQLNECEVGYKDRETLVNQIKTAQAAKN